MLVGVYILWALYMAAQHSAPLRSGEHTMMGGLISFVMVLVYIFYIHNVVGEYTYFIYTKMGGRTSLLLTS